MSRCKVKICIQFADTSPVLSNWIDIGTERSVKTAVLKAIHKDRSWSHSSQIKVLTEEGKSVELKSKVIPEMVYKVYLPIERLQLTPNKKAGKTRQAGDVKLMGPAIRHSLAKISEENDETSKQDANKACDVDEKLVALSETQKPASNSIEQVSDCETPLEASTVADDSEFDDTPQSSMTSTVNEEKEILPTTNGIFRKAYIQVCLFFTALLSIVASIKNSLSDAIVKRKVSMFRIILSGSILVLSLAIGLDYIGGTIFGQKPSLMFSEMCTPAVNQLVSMFGF